MYSRTQSPRFLPETPCAQRPIGDARGIGLQLPHDLRAFRFRGRIPRVHPLKPPDHASDFSAEPPRHHRFPPFQRFERLLDILGLGDPMAGLGPGRLVQDFPGGGKERREATPNPPGPVGEPT
jgi:hypothetical protein